MRIMLNKKGPSEKKRKLYQNVTNSIMLYGAPVWAEEVGDFPNRTKKVRATQRKILRTRYQGVSDSVPGGSNGSGWNPPIELQAKMLRRMYMRKKEVFQTGTKLTDKGIKAMRDEEKEKMIVKWRGKLAARANTRRGFNLEILSCMKEWVCRGHGELTFQDTQLLTGHGCFKGYTHRIGKTDDGACSFCGSNWEDNGHVLFDCSEWRGERETLTREFGGEVRSLDALMRGMVSHPKKWGALIDFADRVMRKKAEVEREEEAERRREELLRETKELLGRRRDDAGRSSAGQRMARADHTQKRCKDV